MDPNTGKIHRMTDKEVDSINEDRATRGEALLIKLKQDAIPGCPKCFGRGWTGRNRDTGLYQTCKCVFKERRKKK